MTIFTWIMFISLTGPLWLYAAVVAGFPFVFTTGIGCVIADWFFPRRA